MFINVVFNFSNVLIFLILRNLSLSGKKKMLFYLSSKLKTLARWKAKPEEPQVAKLWAYTKEKEMATHSSILAWRIPGTEEPGGLPSMGSHRVWHNWSDLAAAARWLYCSSSYPLSQLYCWFCLWSQSLAIPYVCTVRWTQDRQSTS